MLDNPAVNEQEIIQHFFTRQLNDPAVKLSVGDDAAIISPPKGHDIVVSTDSMAEGSHFTKETAPYDLGYKILAVNLSDMAAMGAEPKWATLNITLADFDESWLQQFSTGLFDCASTQQVTLIGGDLCKGTQTHLTVQVLGIVPVGCALRRAGAKPGDTIFVTGTIGRAAQALQQLVSNHYKQDCLSVELRTALYRPQARIEMGIGLRSLANSAIDISDGLLHELKLLCMAGNVGARVDLDRIPVVQHVDINTAITGGEDYELLFTAPDFHKQAISELAAKHSCQIAEIGQITAGGEIELHQRGKVVPLPAHTGYDHFENSEHGK